MRRRTFMVTTGAALAGTVHGGNTLLPPGLPPHPEIADSWQDAADGFARWNASGIRDARHNGSLRPEDCCGGGPWNEHVAMHWGVTAAEWQEFCATAARERLHVLASAWSPCGACWFAFSCSR